MLLQGIGRNDRDAVYPPVFAIADGFCCELSGIEAEDCSLASLRQIFLTLPPPARSETFTAARLRIHGAPPDRRQSEAGRGYGTRAMIFS